MDLNRCSYDRPIIHRTNRDYNKIDSAMVLRRILSCCHQEKLKYETLFEFPMAKE